MVAYLETVVDKFTFKVAMDRYYNEEGVWALPEGDRVRIGLSDFLQQHNGDVAFAEIKPPGSLIGFGDEVAVIETIKVNISLSSPVGGKVVEVNPEMDLSPEIINEDPFGAGWLAIIEPVNWEADRARLLDAQTYFDKMKAEAEEEARK